MRPDNDALDKYFDALRAMSYEDTFDDTVARLRDHARQQAHTRRTFKPDIHAMIRYALTHRFRLTLASLLFAVTFFACNMPVEQEETLGYVISGFVENAGGTLQQTEQDPAFAVFHQIEALPWVKEGQFKTSLVASFVANQAGQADGAGDGFAVGAARQERTMARAIPQGDAGREMVAAPAAGTFQKRGGDETVWPPRRRYAIYLPDATENEARRHVAELEAMDGVVDVSYQPIQATVKRKAYQAAWGVLSVSKKEARVMDREAVALKLKELEEKGIVVRQHENDDGSWQLKLLAPLGEGGVEVRKAVEGAAGVISSRRGAASVRVPEGSDVEKKIEEEKTVRAQRDWERKVAGEDRKN